MNLDNTSALTAPFYANGCVGRIDLRGRTSCAANTPRTLCGAITPTHVASREGRTSIKRRQLFNKWMNLPSIFIGSLQTTVINLKIWELTALSRKVLKSATSYFKFRGKARSGSDVRRCQWSEQPYGPPCGSRTLSCLFFTTASNHRPPLGPLPDESKNAREAVVFTIEIGLGTSTLSGNLESLTYANWSRFLLYSS